MLPLISKQSHDVHICPAANAFACMFDLYQFESHVQMCFFVRPGKIVVLTGSQEHAQLHMKLVWKTPVINRRQRQQLAVCLLASQKLYNYRASCCRWIKCNFILKCNKSSRSFSRMWSFSSSCGLWCNISNFFFFFFFSVLWLVRGGNQTRDGGGHLSAQLSVLPGPDPGFCGDGTSDHTGGRGSGSDVFCKPDVIRGLPVLISLRGVPSAPPWGWAPRKRDPATLGAHLTKPLFILF